MGVRPRGPNNGPHFGYRRFRNNGWGFVPSYYPLWDDDVFSSDFEPEREPVVNVPPPQVIVVEREDRRAPLPPPEPPKLIEVPDTPHASAAKPQPPTLFVFANGEQLEARRYTLTADWLQVEVGRQRRTIALSALDLDATIAANRERGIDLRIPSNPNSIFLGF